MLRSNFGALFGFVTVARSPPARNLRGTNQKAPEAGDEPLLLKDSKAYVFNDPHFSNRLSNGSFVVSKEFALAFAGPVFQSEPSPWFLYQENERRAQETQHPWSAVPKPSPIQPLPFFLSPFTMKTRYLILTLLVAPSLHATLLETFSYAGSSYELYSDELTWADASAFAASRGGVLWCIGSKAENDAVFSRLQAYDVMFTATAADGGGARYAWIGASDAASEGDWIWADGTTFWSGSGAAGGGGGAAIGAAFSNWGSFGGPGVVMEPDNYLGAQNWGAIGLDSWPTGAPFSYGVAGQWNDLSGSHRLPFVVEISAVPEPSTYGLIAAASLAATALLRRRRASNT